MSRCRFQTGCFMHLSSNNWKKIQPPCLQDYYNIDPEFTLNLRMTRLLVLLSPVAVINTFLATDLQRFSDVFRGHKKRSVAWNGLITSRWDFVRNSDYTLEFCLTIWELLDWNILKKHAQRSKPVFSIEQWNMSQRTLAEID